MAMLDDASLYRRWRDRRDRGAFDTLARRHADLVADVARRCAGRVDVAEDALQDAFVALANDGTDRPAVVGVRAWVARSALLAVRHRDASDRARARRERAVGEARPVIGGAATQDDVASVRDALVRLDGEDAVVLTLRYLHGLPYGELAVILDVAEPTARVRVHRALAQLREDPSLKGRGDDAVGAAIAGLPLAQAEAQAVTAAVAAATDAPAVGAASGGAASTLAASRFRRLWWVPFAVAATVAVALEAAVVFRAVRTGDGPLPVTPTGPPDARGAAEAAGAPLAGRLRAAARAEARASDAPAMPGPAAAPPPEPPRPVPRTDAPSPRARRVEVRCELAGDPAAPQTRLPITRLASEFGETLAFERAGDGVVAQLEDGPLFVETDDPRAAVAVVRTVVPERATAVVVSVPSREDPRMASLVLRVVDATTGAPLPAAELEWLPGFGPPEIVRADADGRLRVALGAPPSPLEALRVWAWSATIRAPGHRAYTPKDPPIGLDADATGAWAERVLANTLSQVGTTVGLSTYPTPGFRPRRVRFEDADGAPVAGAYIATAYPPRRDVAALATPNDVGDGFRRTDARGEVDVTFDEVVAVELRFGDAPFAAWGLAAEGWPEGPRVLRVPAWADVEVVVEDIPRPTCLDWWARDARDPLGSARTPLEGPAVEPMLDDAYRSHAARYDLVFPFVHAGVVHARADGSPEGASIRHRARAGAPLRFDLAWDGGPDDASHELRQRVLDVRPTAPGPWRRVVRWDDLPRPR